jgi:Flp pilus assembly protein CpaB
MKAFSLTEGRVAPTLVRFALPFMLSSLLQSLYGAADLFVVGQYAGAAAVSGMVNPNDHVDVIGTFTFPDESGKRQNDAMVTCTILQNVLVLATGKTTAKMAGRMNDGSTQNSYSTVTLEVTPREAEMLAFAEQIRGRLSLSLRNRSDVSYEKELPKVDFEKIRSTIEELNLKRQQKYVK